MNRKRVDQSETNDTMMDMSEATLDELVTVSDAAKIIGVSVQRVHAYLRAARLPHVLRGGRYEIARAAVEQLASQHRSAGRPKKSSTCS